MDFSIIYTYIYAYFQNFFGAPKIDLDTIRDVESNTPDIIVWAAPVLFFFVLLEWYISKKQNKNLYDKKDTIGSIAVGIGNVIINFFLKILFRLIRNTRFL